MTSENDSTAGVHVKPLEVTGVEIDLDSGKVFFVGPNYFTELAAITWKEFKALPSNLKNLIDFHRLNNGYSAIVAA